jgi:FtsH-binding integral membrane protein
MSGTTEKRIPWWGGFIGAIVALVIAMNVRISDEKAVAILQSLGTFALIMSGFMGTLLIIVLSFSDRPLFRRLANDSLHKRLFGFMGGSIYGAFGVAACSIVLLFDRSSGWTYLIAAIMGFCLGFSVAACAMVKYPIQKLIENTDIDPDQP